MWILDSNVFIGVLLGREMAMPVGSVGEAYLAGAAYGRFVGEQECLVGGDSWV